jgi:PTH1 family peptidyl-tRNA hydrolase
MRCILGIGNPGATYDGTRHNLGFAVVDEIARRHAAALGAWQRKWSAEVCAWRLPATLVPADGDERALLIKPQTFVNLSGEAAQAVLAFHKIAASDLLVVVDDLSLKLGDLRLRPEGSAGGHNGLRDIEAKLGRNYPRLRVGMGPMPAGADQVGFVLGRFAPEDRATAEQTVRKAADCAEAWVRDGVAVACRYNGPLVPPEPRVKPPARPMAERAPEGPSPAAPSADATG